VQILFRSNARTEVLSKVEFNGIGWLRTHISFTRIGVRYAAMRISRRSGILTREEDRATTKNVALLPATQKWSTQCESTGENSLLPTIRTSK
jgi:hypothetical protein